MCRLCTPPRAVCVGHVTARAARGLAAWWPEFERRTANSKAEKKMGVPQTRRASTPSKDGAGLLLRSVLVLDKIGHERVYYNAHDSRS